MYSLGKKIAFIFLRVVHWLRPRPKQIDAPPLPIQMRPLEPRRVLSVNATFAAGVLDIAIQDDGGTTQATLMTDSNDTFFVDADGDFSFDDGTSGNAELRGLLSELTEVNVTGDAGVGSFFWRDNFSSALLDSAASVTVSNVDRTELTATANIDGDVSLSAADKIGLGGELDIAGNLTAVTTGGNSEIVSLDNSSVHVGGLAQFQSSSVTLGTAANTEFSVGSLTVNATHAVVIVEDFDANNPTTFLVGNNSAANFTLESGNSLTLASNATLSADGLVDLSTSTSSADLVVNGDIQLQDGILRLHAQQDITFGGSSNIAALGTADALVQADAGSIIMSDGASLSIQSGSVELQALGNNGHITLGNLHAGNLATDTIHVQALGDINDGTNSEAANLQVGQGTAILHSTQGNIGSLNDDINIDAANLAFTAAGNLHLSDSAGGLNISDTSLAGAATIVAHSPLTISANITVNASSTFTAGNSGSSGDNVTIQNGAVVTLNSATNSSLTINAGDDIVFDTGRVETLGANHTVFLNADLDTVADGDRGSITQDGTAQLEVITDNLVAQAAESIDLDIDAAILTAKSSFVGNIQINELNDVILQDITTEDGSIDIHSGGAILANTVRAVGATADVNLVSFGGNVPFNITGSITAENDVNLEVMSGDLFLASLFATNGTATLDVHDGDVVIGFLFAGTDVVIMTPNGAINDLHDDAFSDITAGRDIRLTARDQIGGTGTDTKLELAGGSNVFALSQNGHINLRGLGELTLSDVEAQNGPISIMAQDTIRAVRVDASGTDSDSNDVTLISNAGNVEIQSVRAGLLLGDVVVEAFHSIADADIGIDDIDIEANDVTLTASNSNIGLISTSLFKGLPNPIEIVTHAQMGGLTNLGDLQANAPNGIVAIHATVAGQSTLNTDTLFLQSDGDLDATSLTLTASNLALIADADGDGNGTLTIDPTVSVTGDLRLEGDEITSSASTLTLNSDRLLFATGGTASLSITTGFADISAEGDLTVTTEATTTFVDFNCDNVALQTTGASGSIHLTAKGDVTLADDVIAGNDGTTATSGSIQLSFAGGHLGDLLILDTVLADHGSISLSAPGDIRLEPGLVTFDGLGADNLALITTIDGNITLTADTDLNGGELFLADSSRIIAGRDTLPYLPGTDGNASPSTISLGSTAKGSGQAEVRLAATDAVTLGSVQTTNNTADALSVQSFMSSILDGGDSEIDLIADFANARATLIAHTGIGLGNALDSAIHELDAQSQSGIVAINEVAAGGDLITTRISTQGNVVVQTSNGSLTANQLGVQAQGGHISLVASNDLFVDANITTDGTGTVLLQADNDITDAVLPFVDGINISAPVLTSMGDILAASQQDFRLTSSITSTTGNVGLFSTRHIEQSGTVTTAGDVASSAGGDIRMDATASQSSGSRLVLSADGNIELALVSAPEVAIAAAGAVTDSNSGATNVNSTSLSVQAGGTIGKGDNTNGTPDANQNAIDIATSTVAANGSAVYLQHSGASGLTVSHVDSVSTNVLTSRVELDGTLTPQASSLSLAALDDLNSTVGPIKVLASNGPLRIEDGLDGDGFGVHSAGDILLHSSLDIEILAQVSSNGGHITLNALDDIFVAADVSTSGQGDLVLFAGNSIANDAPITAVDGINLDAALATEDGTILLGSQQDVRIAANLNSTTGAISIETDGDLLLDANLLAGGDILLQSGGQIDMASTSSIVSQNNLAVVALADVQLAELSANNIALDSGGLIQDSNAANVNIVATTLQFSGQAFGSDDSVNGSPGDNLNAIDTVVGTVAGSSTNGIYLHQVAATDLSISHVVGISLWNTAQQVRFNSITSPTNQSRSFANADDVHTTSGPVKISVEGDLFVQDGLDADGVGISTDGTGGILLRASGDVFANADVASVSGNIALQAGASIDVNAAVNTGGTGTVLLQSGANTDIDETVTTANGDILIQSQQDLRTTAVISSTTGDIGLTAVQDIDQTADISTAGDILFDAGGCITTTSGIATSAGTNLLVDADGKVNVGLYSATNVAIDAGSDILDNNGADILNIAATNLRMTAAGTIGQPDTGIGTPDANANAIDLEVDTVAAQSASGIYLQELSTGGDLIVGQVDLVSVSIDVAQPRFNSTSDPVNQSATLSALDDLTTTDNGAIKLAVQGGTLTTNEEISADATGDILLQAASDIIINAALSSGSGNIALQAAASLDLNAALSTGGIGSVLLQSGAQTDIDETITTADGDILIQSQQDLRTTAVISSTTGNIGLAAVQNIEQAADITTAGDVLLDAGGNITTASGIATNAGTNLLVDAGGSIHLGLYSATNVAIKAWSDILDNNGADILNIAATNLRMTAGGTIGQPDIGNGTPDANANAIDLEVDTVAAQSASGIYLQELSTGGDLIVGQVDLVSVSVDVSQPRFNSTSDPVNQSSSLVALDDLTTTDNGSIKVAVQGGTLTANEEVTAGGTGDVLLRATSDIVVNSALSSETGNIALQAAANLNLNAALSTGGTGSVLLQSGVDTDVDGTVTTAVGDILIQSQQEIRTTAVISSTTGDIGLVAVQHIDQSADITTAGNVLLAAGGAITTASGIATSAGTNLLVDAGGSVNVGLYSATNVAIDAGSDILDNNGADILNIAATNLRMTAGGTIGQPDTGNGTPDANGNAIDLEVDTLAAQSASGIYLQELSTGGDLIVGQVDLVSVSVDVSQPRFNSTSDPVNQSSSLVALDDLTTTDNGSIKLAVQGGTLTTNEEVTANGTGDILLQATSDMVINADVTSGTGNIALQAAANIDLNAALSTSGTGSVLLQSGADTDVDGTVTTADGDILIQSQQEIRTTAVISSTTGDIGLTAVQHIDQSADITTAGNVLLAAGGNITTASGIATSAGTNLLVDAGGTVNVGLYSAANVAVDAGSDILDNNGADVLNIAATNLRMTAGGTIGQPDAGNGTPDANANAIDLEVDTVAAQSASGIYLQELSTGGDLIVGQVDLVSVSIDVAHPRFNSTSDPVNQSSSLVALDDLTKTNNGSIKVTVQGGTLTANEEITADGIGDILLQATSDIIINADVTSGTGNTALQAAANIDLNAALSTGGTGSVLLQSGADTDVDGTVTTAVGDILIQSQQDLRTTAVISSTTGDIGLVAVQDIDQTADITTAGDVLLDAGGDITTASGIATSAGTNLLVDAGGSIHLGLYSATNVAINAGSDILDNNGVDILNIAATNLRMTAGGTLGQPDAGNGTPDANGNAIDLEVDTLAAQSSSGIYLQELSTGGDLIVGQVDLVSVSVDVAQPRFNSTSDPVNQSATLSALDDLTTTDNGSIKLAVQGGTLTATEEITADGTGDVLLRATSDIVINADVTSGSGNIALQAAANLDLNAALSTGGTGTVLLQSGVDTDIDGTVTTAVGDILIQSQQDLRTTAVISSATGDFGMTAVQDIEQAADITTAGDVLLDAGGNITTASGIATNAGTNLLVDADGMVNVGLYSATNVAIDAGIDILDNNGADVLNIAATNLRMTAGGTIGQPDTGNGTPDANANAIDLEVDTVAALSATGIYLQELSPGGELIVGQVDLVSVSIGVAQPRFNSTSDPVNQSSTLAALDDLTTTDNGSIKVAVQGGTLTANEEVTANGTGDILLQATSDMVINADLTSSSGNIAVQAAANLDLNAALSTSGTGTVLLQSGAQTDIDETVTTADGDILIQSQQDLRTTAVISSTTGDIGLTAVQNIDQSANITTAGNVMLAAGGNISTASGIATSAGSNLLVDAGGSVNVGLYSAANIAINAGSDILDNNGVDILNIAATNLRMTAGGTIGQADTGNGTPDVNANAIDLEVDTLAAQSATGIYLQELSTGGDLIVGQVDLVSVSIDVAQPRFNSTSDPVNQSSSLAALDDLTTTDNGSIKLSVRGGTLTTNEEVTANGTGDILLRATSDIVINADVTSGSGNIALQAAASLDLNAALSTSGTGTVLLQSGVDTDIDGTVTTAVGDILIQSQQDLRTTAVISSATGNIGLVTVQDIEQSANITTAGDVLFDAGGNITTASGIATSAGTNLLVDAGGTVNVGLYSATNVAIDAGSDILDNNGADILNIAATNLRMTAGGTIGQPDTGNGTPDANANAIDLEVDTLAAQSATGIYLQELSTGGDLIVGQVDLVSVSIDVTQPRFNSTSDPVNQSATLSALDDLTTTDDGSIKLSVQGGTLTANEEVTADGTGDILLQATSDIVINAALSSGTGNIALQAAANLDLNAALSTSGTGSVLLQSGADTDVDGTVTTSDGDILIQSQQEIRTTAVISSTTGDIGLAAVQDIEQAAGITTAGDILLDAGGNITTAGGIATSAGTNLLVDAGAKVNVAMYSASNVAINAGSDILDNNGADILNIAATNLRMTAGGTIGQPDTGNGTPDANGNAIDLEVDTLAAQSSSGIYLQELSTGGDLIVGQVDLVSVSIDVALPRFNSTSDPVNQSATLSALDDLTTTDNGSIKLAVQGGTLTANEEITADGTGDVLLRATSDIVINAALASGTGNIALQAAVNLDLNAALSTGGTGSVLFQSGAQTDIDETVNTAEGAILIQSQQDLRTTAVISSTTGDIGLVAVQHIDQSADITTAGNVLLDAGGNITTASGVATSAGTNLLVDADGTVNVGLYSATNVAINAGSELLDNNGADVLNIAATNLRLTAGGTIGQPDTVNGTPDANANAIDLEVDTLAAQSASGIYLQELSTGGDLIVGQVDLVSVSIDVAQPRFNSTSDPVNQSSSLSVLDDLTTTDNGSIKLAVQGGTLTTNEEVTADGTGDILLQATSDIIINAALASGTGNIALQAAANLDLNAALSTGGTGSVLLQSGADTDIDGTVTTSDGDILIQSQQDLRTTAVISSTTGDIGLAADQHIEQTADITTAGDVLLDAGGNITTASGIATSAGTNLLVDAGGSVNVGLYSAANVAIDAGSDILDNNGADSLNIAATNLRMTAGGTIGQPDAGNGTPDANANAIDLEVDTLAAQSATGIYLQELSPGGDLIVGQVDLVSVSIDVALPRFNSTSDPVNQSATLSALDDLTTTDNGAIKLAVQGGTLTANEEVTADGTGDILLRATSDIVVNADLTSSSGNIAMQAAANLDLNAALSTGGTGTVLLQSGMDTDIDETITTAEGAILIQSQQDLWTTAVISSTTGDIGLAAAQNIDQSANITTAGDVLLDAGGDITTASGIATSAGTNLLVDADGTVNVGLYSATNVAVDAGSDILDNNGADSLNIAATNLRVTAGGTIGQADAGNGTPDANANAIDLEVNTVAAQSTSGIYLQELGTGGDLIVGHVDLVSVSIDIAQPRFNSTSDPVNQSSTLAALDDLTTTDNGSIKVSIRGGQLSVVGGDDGDDIGVSADGAGDVLLTTGLGEIQISSDADISSGTGHVSVLSATSLQSDGDISTAGTGTIMLSSETDLLMSGSASTQHGDILYLAGNDLIVGGDIQSDFGNLGWLVTGNIAHDGSVSTGGDVLVQADGNVVMSSSASIMAGSNAMLLVGRSGLESSQTLGLVVADNVSIEASGDLLDANANATNIIAKNALLVADSDGDGMGGIATPADRMDLAVDNLAAKSSEGIYAHQVAVGGTLTIGHASSRQVAVDVSQTQFNSTTTSVQMDATIDELSDVETQSPRAPGLNAIEISVENGSLIILDGHDGDSRGISVLNGSIVLDASHHILLETGIVTAGQGVDGNVTMTAGLAIDELSDEAHVIADGLTIVAGQHAHLHDTSVNSLTASVESNGLLDATWQQTNDKANQKGDDFLDELGQSRLASAANNGVMTEVDRLASPNVRDASLRQDLDDITRQFRYEDTYQSQYALFLQNDKSLEVLSIDAGSTTSADAPNVYVETTEVDSNLNIQGVVQTKSSSATEGGIVLLAGGELNLAGTLITESMLSPSVARLQFVNEIGNATMVLVNGETRVAYLDARAFDGGDGIAPIHPTLTSTQFVIRDQQQGLSALSEDYRTHVFQRVVMQFGFAQEAGFVGLVGYADGEIQQFDVSGEEGVRTKTMDFLSADQTAIQAFPQTDANAAAFTRSIAFDNAFLDANQMLPTTAIIRRAADFFLFENTAADTVEELRDMTFEAFEIEEVTALGAKGATELPEDAKSVQPPAALIVTPDQLIPNPTQLVNTEIELTVPRERTVEVAIFRVFYEDENANGQPEERELPDASQVIDAQIVEDSQSAKKAIQSGNRLRLESLKTESGGSPTVEDIEKLKNRYLDDPQQPSGAYAIVEKGVDDEETVLDVFSVRDVEEAESVEDDNEPIIRVPDAATKQATDEEKEDDQDDEGIDDEGIDDEGIDDEGIGDEDKDDEGVDNGGQQQPAEQPSTDNSTSYRRLPETGDRLGNIHGAPRFENAALVAGSVWFAATIASKQANGLIDNLATQETENRVSFDRQARRRRRLQRFKKRG